VDHHLTCIRSLQPALNAFITVTAEDALRRAAELDAELERGSDRGPLHGIPIVHKDSLATRGVRTTVGSRLLESRVPDHDAAIVERLSNAGAIMLGKANMSEFGSGSSGVNAHFGAAHNPWDVSRTPGGSSSGSAVAVASGMAVAATGTDAGGSVRTPASRCSIVGLRPTYGLVSLYGTWPRTKTLGAAGPMTQSVEDAAIMLNCMAGYDERYPASIKSPDKDYTKAIGRGAQGMRIGLVRDFSRKELDSEVDDALTRALDVFAKLGVEIVDVVIPELTGALDYSTLFRHIMLWEFNEVLGEQYRNTPNRDEVFGPFVHADMQRVQSVTRRDYESTVSRRWEHVRSVREIFRRVDALITPTVPDVPPLQSEGPETWLRGRTFNLPFSYLGLPGISIPCHLSKEGLPIGMQLVANDLGEMELLRLAHAFEEAGGFPASRPPIYCTMNEPEL